MTYQLYNYNTCNEIQIQYNVIKNKIITELSTHIMLNKDVLDMVFNYIVPEHKYQLLTKEDCIRALILRGINKKFSLLLQIYNLRHIDNHFNNYDLLLDECYTCYKGLIKITKRLEIINNENIATRNLIINTHRKKIMFIIKYYKQQEFIKDSDHSDYIYLCNFYEYKYKLHNHSFIHKMYDVCSLYYFSIPILLFSIYCLYMLGLLDHI